MDLSAGVAAITVASEDLAVTRAFYERAFGLIAVHEDDDSVVFRLGPTLLNVLRVEQMPELVRPAAVAAAGAGSRAVYTLEVDDVDATCAELAERGVELLSDPEDRPWGIRTASVQDPDGVVWELAH